MPAFQICLLCLGKYKHEPRNFSQVGIFIANIAWSKPNFKEFFNTFEKLNTHIVNFNPIYTGHYFRFENESRYFILPTKILIVSASGKMKYTKAALLRAKLNRTEKIYAAQCIKSMSRTTKLLFWVISVKQRSQGRVGQISSGQKRNDIGCWLAFGAFTWIFKK